MANFGPERENAGTMTFAIENGVLKLRFTAGTPKGRRHDFIVTVP